MKNPHGDFRTPLLRFQQQQRECLNAFAEHQSAATGEPPRFFQVDHLGHNATEFYWDFQEHWTKISEKGLTQAQRDFASAIGRTIERNNQLVADQIMDYIARELAKGVTAYDSEDEE